MANPILLVEDTLTLMMELEDVFQSAGYTVVTAYNVRQAHAAIRTSHTENTPFAAILSDYNLGDLRPESGKTGINVFQYAWRIYGDTMPPFIASSTEMKYWDPFKKTAGVHLIPKTIFHWDYDAVLAKLTELGITP